MPAPVGIPSPMTTSEFLDHWRTFQAFGRYTCKFELEATKDARGPYIVVVARGIDHQDRENIHVPHPEEVSIQRWPSATHKHLLAVMYWLLNDVDSRIAAARHLRKQARGVVAPDS